MSLLYKNTLNKKCLYYISEKNAQIEIEARYITVGKQFVGFSLRQERISSTAVVVAEDDTQTI